MNNKPLLCQLGIHKTRHVKGVDPVIICSRCQRIIVQKRTIFSKEKLVFFSFTVIILLLIYVILMLKGCL
jgi:predicted nucleic acid-binding Zn ribbon protein